jgi:hypothetical protein
MELNPITCVPGIEGVSGDFPRNNCPIAAALATVNRVGKKGFSSGSHRQ